MFMTIWGIKSDGSISYDFFLCLEPINSTFLAGSQYEYSLTYCYIINGDNVWSFGVEVNLLRFFIVCLYLICSAIWDPIIKRGNPINWFNPITFLWLMSQARTWISNATCHGLLMFSDLRWEVAVCFVDVGGIVAVIEYSWYILPCTHALLYKLWT